MTDAVDQTVPLTATADSPAPAAAAASAAAAPVPTGGTAAAAARGATSVSEEVIEKIAVGAAREVSGVAALGGDVARFFNNVLDRVGLDEVGDASRGASAKVTGDSVVVNLVIVIESGHVVSEVTEAVRAKVIEAVEKFGLRVSQVNINVDDIELGSRAAAGTAG